MYVSITADAEYMAVGTSGIAFGSVSASSKAFNDVAGGYSAAGWYGAAAVPEPTSGLLMLLGMARPRLRFGCVRALREPPTSGGYGLALLLRHNVDAVSSFGEVGMCTLA